MSHPILTAEACTIRYHPGNPAFSAAQNIQDGQMENDRCNAGLLKCVPYCTLCTCLFCPRQVYYSPSSIRVRQRRNNLCISGVHGHVLSLPTYAMASLSHGSQFWANHPSTLQRRKKSGSLGVTHGMGTFLQLSVH